MSMNKFTNKSLIEEPWNFPEAMLYQSIFNSSTSVSIAIIGAHVCSELETLSKLTQVKSVAVFEPMTAYKDLLIKKLETLFKGRYLFSSAAVSNQNGFTIFHETNIPGTGSLLQIGSLSKKSYNMKHANSQQCETIRFDDFCKTNDFHADILWIDVQGAEMMVLEGAHKSLDSIHHIFIEISIWEPTYIEGCTMTEITEKLLKYGFKCIQLGTDLKNGTGNALFSRYGQTSQ